MSWTGSEAANAADLAGNGHYSWIPAAHVQLGAAAIAIVSADALNLAFVVSFPSDEDRTAAKRTTVLERGNSTNRSIFRQSARISLGAAIPAIFRNRHEDCPILASPLRN